MTDEQTGYERVKCERCDEMVSGDRVADGVCIDCMTVEEFRAACGR